jgi:EAL domain-containing protein (putative c-di-GMP-specific phosphodiesterase class I)
VMHRCDAVQGYYFGKPTPAHEGFTELFQGHSYVTRGERS